nr:AIF_HP1_G0030830.mRNA.1.CDS.1 [Saccharomyces cerevisiae]
MNALDSKIYPDDNFSGLESSKEQKSPGVSSSSTKVEDLSLDGLNEKRLSITSSENVETPYTATNLQSNVEYSNNEGIGSQETFRTKLPTIEALQLQHKRNITDLREEIDNSKSNDSHVLSNGGTTRYSSDADYKETEPIEFKYPPGEGPCRACGLEVTGKRMFSKKENELSGQWHRECFKCIECGIKFNKHVPCYILGDEPYCQKH